MSAVNVGVCEYFPGDLTQFLHNSKGHLFAYAAVFIGTLHNDVASSMSVGS
jgi:hypothetical protein